MTLPAIKMRVQMEFNKILICKSVYQSFMAHVKRYFPNEAGGMLCGPINFYQNLLTHFIPSPTDESGPYTFATTPEAEQPMLNRIHALYEFDLRGYGHSHAYGPAYPSHIDLKTSESLFHRMMNHNGTSPIMALAYKEKSDWGFKTFSVVIESGKLSWKEIPFQVVPDLDWTMRDVIRPRPMSGGNLTRILDELNHLSNVFGDDVKFSQNGSCIDADVPYKTGILRIRVSERFPECPPRLWFCDENGMWHNCYHLWMSIWNDSFTLWEMIDCTDEFIRPPWERKVFYFKKEVV